MKRTVLLALCGALGATSVSAGPWPQAPGTLFAKLSGSALTADELATRDGDSLAIPTYRRQELDLYLQAPLGARWTFIAALPLYRYSEIAGFDEAGGVGDVTAGVQVLLAQPGSWLLAARLLAQAPTGDETQSQGILPTGSGVWEGELVLSVGRSFSGGTGYGFAEVGQRTRGGGFADSLVWRGELGLRAGARWQLAARAWGQDAAEPDSADIGSPSGFGDGVSFVALGPSITRDLSGPWAAQLEVDFALDGRNIALGPTFRLAFLRLR